MVYAEIVYINVTNEQIRNGEKGTMLQIRNYKIDFDSCNDRGALDDHQSSSPKILFLCPKDPRAFMTDFHDPFMITVIYYHISAVSCGIVTVGLINDCQIKSGVLRDKVLKEYFFSCKYSNIAAKVKKVYITEFP